jgi:hypothetical protein
VPRNKAILAEIVTAWTLSKAAAVIHAVQFEAHLCTVVPPEEAAVRSARSNLAVFYGRFDRNRRTISRLHWTQDARILRRLVEELTVYAI